VVAKNRNTARRAADATKLRRIVAVVIGL